MHDAFGKTEQFRMAETFAGLAGSGLAMIRRAACGGFCLSHFVLYLTNNY